MNHLEKISHETMVFMRGKYCLDEIGDGKDELKFKQGQKTILTIYTHENCFTFLMIFGRKEREVFETQITTMEQLEEVKRLILIKKKPHRKPFPKENAVYSECKECSEFPCIKATSADYRSMIHTEVHYADEITWGILPYVPMQYDK